MTMDEMDSLADLKVALYPTDGPSDELRARALAPVAGGGVGPRPDDIEPGDLYPDNTISRGLGSSDTVTFRSSDYPAGGGLLVVVTSSGGDSGRPVPPDPVSVAIFAFDNAGKIPTCVDFADPGTGTP